jgi:hypothetical protein
VTCDIRWGQLTIAEWDRYFASVPRSTLLQHYPYAQALRSTQYLGARHGLIYLDDIPSGLVQICEARILRDMVHVIQLDRGPLWFSERVKLSDVGRFFSAFNVQFPRRPGRRRRILPEFEGSSAVIRQHLSESGLVVKPHGPQYETVWLDLSKDIPSLRSEIDERGTTAGPFLMGYEQEKQTKGYPGPTVALLKALISFMAPRREVAILWARDGTRVLASVLFLIHGRSATYQAGWTTPDGRRVACHNRLLWEGVARLKARGILDLDLGGINSQHATGVTKFKLGLGGTPIVLCGQFA